MDLILAIEQQAEDIVQAARDRAAALTAQADRERQARAEIAAERLRALETEHAAETERLRSELADTAARQLADGLAAIDRAAERRLVAAVERVVELGSGQ
ncbi:MAG: hypothetical protein GX907_00410 [Clostridiaceae bacterium]|nr:hypothetical protein [Clostridiaceae bacterium]